MELSFKIDDMDTVEVIQGETRTLNIRIVERDTFRPISLVGAVIKFEAQRTDGRFFSRSNETKVIEKLDLANDTWAVTKHGYVDGDPLVLSTTGTLPSGFSPGTYYVVNSSESLFQLTATLSGAPILLSDVGSGIQSVTGAIGSIVSPAQLGEFNVLLSAVASSGLQVGNFFSPEVEFTISGVTRIVRLDRALTITAQTA